MKFKRNNEPRVPWIYLQELSLLLDYKHSTIPNDLVALCTIHHTKHQKHTTLCASWWSWINFLSITLSFQLQYSSVIRESIFKRFELSWIASITSERCSNISSRSDELILERKKKAHSGTWTHNLLLRRQAPYPIRLCVLVGGLHNGLLLIARDDWVANSNNPLSRLIKKPLHNNTSIPKQKKKLSQTGLNRRPCG